MKFCSVAMRKLKQPMRNYIASTGVSYIRDDLYAGSWEPSTGVYVQPSRDMGWLTATKANGLKVVGILGPNWHYQDNYDPVAMSNLAAWIAKTGLVSAFEITNEPNNAYASYEGSTWQTKLVALTNAVTAAVHAVNPSIQVIGLGAQGTQIFNVLAWGPRWMAWSIIRMATGTDLFPRRRTNGNIGITQTGFRC